MHLLLKNTDLTFLLLFTLHTFVNSNSAIINVLTYFFVLLRLFSTMMKLAVVATLAGSAAAFAPSNSGGRLS